MTLEIQISENELSDFTNHTRAPVQSIAFNSLQLSSKMSSNLHSLLKNQIREAVAHLYSTQSTAAANVYSHPDEFSKALLDVLFPAEADNNTQVTGVVKVPTLADESKSDGESSDSSSKKERKKRAPMSDDAKAAMKAKREATVAAKKAADVPVEPEVKPKAKAAKAPEPVAPAEPEPEAKETKERKARGPMSDEAKAAMKAKREATLAAKKAAQV